MQPPRIQRMEKTVNDKSEMIAVILAAGMGKRLGELTAETPKCMIEVGGETIIDRLLNSLIKNGLQQIYVVTGFMHKKLAEHIASKFDMNKISFIHNKRYKSTNNIYSLSLIKKYIKDKDVMIFESDVVLQASIIKKLKEHAYPNLAILASHKFWMNGTMVKIDTEDNIYKILSYKEYNIDESEEYYKTVNAYKFSNDFIKNRYFPFLKAYIQVSGTNNFYEQVLNILSLIDKTELKGLVLGNESWYEIDDLEDLNNANVLFNKKGKLSNYQKKYGGYWKDPKLLDFCYLVNPYFPNDSLKKEIQKFSNVLLTSYPSGHNNITLSVASFFQINSDFICVGNGASEIIKILLSKVIKGKIGIIFPTFEEYGNCVNNDKIVPFFPADVYKYSYDTICGFYKDKDISALLVINPDNPSGNLINRNDMFSLLRWANKNEIKIILDESFIDFADNANENTLLSNDLLKSNPFLILIKSISKSYGVPGIRLGILCSSDIEMLKEIKRHLPIWNINSYAEFFLQIIKKYRSEFEISCSQLRKDRKKMFEELQDIDYLKVYPSQSNYFLCKLIKKYSSKALTETLLSKYNILIKDCSGKTGLLNKDYVRISVKRGFDNDKLINCLKKIN